MFTLVVYFKRMRNLEKVIVLLNADIEMFLNDFLNMIKEVK